jgi:hypothetical protein
VGEAKKPKQRGSILLREQRIENREQGEENGEQGTGRRKRGSASKAKMI